MLHEDQPEMPGVNPDKVCFIITKAREFFATTPLDVDNASNMTDDNAMAMLDDGADRPVREEFAGFVAALDQDEADAVLALMWIGRGDFESADWRAAITEAAVQRPPNFADYLLSQQLLPDYLEDALSAFDRSCAGFQDRNFTMG